MDRHWQCQLGPNGTQGGAQGPEVFRQRTRGRTLGPRLPPGKGTAAGHQGQTLTGWSDREGHTRNSLQPRWG